MNAIFIPPKRRNGGIRNAILIPPKMRNGGIKNAILIPPISSKTTTREKILDTA